MRVINVRHIPLSVTHFTRHGLFPDVQSTLRAMFTDMYDMLQKERDFDLAKFLTSTYVFSEPESKFREMVAAYQSNDGELKASEFDPIIQECIQVIKVLSADVDFICRAEKEVKPFYWHVEVLVNQLDYVYIYDTSSIVREMDAVEETILGLGCGDLTVSKF